MTEAPGHSLARVFDAAAADYEATGTAYFAPMGRRLVELADLRPGQRVLDLGTGRGAVLHPAAAAVGPAGHVAGLDLSVRMAVLTTADLITTDLTAARRSAAVVVADAARPPLRGPFDAVLGGMVAQFLPEPVPALRRWAALTTGGGRLALSWWAGEDERFAHLGEVVARHVPPGARRSPGAFSGDVTATRDAVVAGGWTEVRTHVEEQHVVFTDAAAWWRWSWSHGQRQRWEAVPDLDALRRDVDPELRRLAGPDGRILYRPRAAYTLAAAPGA